MSGKVQGHGITEHSQIWAFWACYQFFLEKYKLDFNENSYIALYQRDLKPILKRVMSGKVQGHLVIEHSQIWTFWAFYQIFDKSISWISMKIY